MKITFTRKNGKVTEHEDIFDLHKELDERNDLLEREGLDDIVRILVKDVKRDRDVVEKSYILPVEDTNKIIAELEETVEDYKSKIPELKDYSGIENTLTDEDIDIYSDLSGKDVRALHRAKLESLQQNNNEEEVEEVEEMEKVEEVEPVEPVEEVEDSSRIATESQEKESIVPKKIISKNKLKKNITLTRPISKKKEESSIEVYETVTIKPVSDITSRYLNELREEEAKRLRQIDFIQNELEEIRRVKTVLEMASR